MVRWGALAVWFWLMIGAETCFADYMRDRPAGQMAGLLPFAAGMLVLLGSCRRLYGRLCAPGLMCVLPALGMLAGLVPLLWPGAVAAAGIWPCCLLAGAGSGLALAGRIRELKELSPPLCAAVVGGGMLGAWLLVNSIPQVAPGTLLCLWAAAALVAGITVGCPPESAPPPSGTAGHGWLALALFCCVISGLGMGIYAALWETFAPLLELTAGECAVSLLVAAAPVLALLPAWRNGPLLLTTLPFAVVAYTAWPLFHRESPALSLQSLHVSYFLLLIWMLSLLAPLGRRLPGWPRPALFGAAAALTGGMLGKLMQPLVEQCLMQGTEVNVLFLLLAVLALVCVVLWGYLWQTPAAARQDMPEKEAEGEDREHAVPQDLEACRQIFRQLGLTPQQALIAAMLAHKRSDADICLHLSISPATLKTHIRNILRRTGINSRHELPWLLLSVRSAQHSADEQGTGALPGRLCRGRDV